VHSALEALATAPARCFAGKDADGRAILRSKGKPPAPATVNRYAAALGSVISWSIKRRIAPKGFVHPCKSVEMRPENNEKTRFLTEDERTRLLAACQASKWKPLYLLALLAISTGARKGELLGLRWADIDLVHRVAHVGHSKNGDPKVLPLIPSVLELLQAGNGKPTALVFASTRAPGQAFSFEPRWSEALRAAKIRGVTFHTLRHSCASFLAQNGATLLEIADLLGHRQLSMTKRYSHLASSHRSTLVNRVLGNLR
jgi:integrase